MNFIRSIFTSYASDDEGEDDDDDDEEDDEDDDDDDSVSLSVRSLLAIEG